MCISHADMRGEGRADARDGFEVAGEVAAFAGGQAGSDGPDAVNPLKT